MKMTKKIILVLIILLMISFGMHFSEYRVTPDILFQNAEKVLYKNNQIQDDLSFLLSADEKNKFQSCIIRIEKLALRQVSECVGVVGTPDIYITINNSTIPDQKIIITDEINCGDRTQIWRFAYPFRWKWNWIDWIFHECATCEQDGIHHLIFLDKNCLEEFEQSLTR